MPATGACTLIRAGGLPLPEVFGRLRLRVNDASKGAQVPWDAEKIDAEMRPFAESTIRKLRQQYAARPSAQAGSAPAVRLRLVVPKKSEADPAE